MRAINRAAALLGAAAALWAGGCGGDDGDANADRFEGQEKAVAEVVDRLGEAARDGDTKTICEDLVTVELQTSVRQTSGTSCAQEFEENIVSEETSFTVQSVEVRGDRATAVVRDQEERRSTLTLARVEGDWRIASID